MSRRSAIKLIVERDDVPNKHLILFVSDLKIVDGVAEIKLSDGWYEIKATLDKPLNFLAVNGKIFLGQKLHIQGSTLVGSNDACEPLDIPSSLSLKISRNGVRRAKWNATLGYQKQQFFPVALHTLSSAGGLVPMVDIIITRKYHVLLMEKRDTFTIYRTFQEEEQEDRNWNKKFEDALEEAQKLYENDPSAFDLLDNSRESLMDAFKRFAEDAVPRRQVQYSCDFRVVDYVESHLKLRSSTVLKDAFISISSLSEDFFDQFKEGSRIRFFSLQGVPSYHSQTSTITLRYNNRSAFVPAVIPDSNPNPYHSHRSLARNLSTISHDEECDACLVVLRKCYTIGNFLTPNVV
jgi:hypothetical protein